MEKPKKYDTTISDTMVAMMVMVNGTPEKRKAAAALRAAAANTAGNVKRALVS